MLSKGVLRECPTARDIFKEELIKARTALRTAMDRWAASSKRNQDDIRHRKTLRKMHKQSQEALQQTRKELEKMSKLMEFRGELGRNKRIINEELAMEETTNLSDLLETTEASTQSCEEQLARLDEEMSTRREEMISYRDDAKKQMLRLDKITIALSELSQAPTAKIFARIRQSHE